MVYQLHILSHTLVSTCFLWYMHTRVGNMKLIAMESFSNLEPFPYLMCVLVFPPEFRVAWVVTCLLLFNIFLWFCDLICGGILQTFISVR